MEIAVLIPSRQLQMSQVQWRCSKKFVKLHCQIQNAKKAMNIYENGNDFRWLTIDDIAYVCIQKYNIFPIILNGKWNPTAKLPKRERTALQLRKLVHGKPEDSTPTICPTTALHKNEPSASQNCVFIKFVRLGHYQPLGTFDGRGNLITKFKWADLSPLLKHELEQNCMSRL